MIERIRRTEYPRYVLSSGNIARVQIEENEEETNRKINAAIQKFAQQNGLTPVHAARKGDYELIRGSFHRDETGNIIEIEITRILDRCIAINWYARNNDDYDIFEYDDKDAVLQELTNRFQKRLSEHLNS